MKLPEPDACRLTAEYASGDKVCRVYFPCDADPQEDARLVRCLAGIFSAEIFSEENAGKCPENGENRKKSDDACEI